MKDWTITRGGEEPKDFWSQSMCYGSTNIEGSASKALVRFRNSGGRNYLRAEAHLIYRTRDDATKVSYHWTDDAGDHSESQLIPAGAQSGNWKLPTGNNVKTRWVEMEDIAP